MFAWSVQSGPLCDLNDEQRLAATGRADRPLLVLAGAGTGKTATLCARVAWLIEEGVPPERILLLTFTRRAARQMLARARALPCHSGTRARGEVVGGTFHSIACRLIGLYAEPLGLPTRVSVLDSGDSADLIDVVREELGFAESGVRFPRKSTLADLYSRTVNAQRPLAEVVAEQFPWCERHVEAIASIFRGYTRRKGASQALDLDDLLLYWRALATHETAGRRLEAMFDHVLVDEYQDVNAIQVDIIRALRRDRRGLTVVGDDQQAIYGFRAASSRHILDFTTVFPDAATVTLVQNYRSTQPILDVANAVSAQAEQGYPRRLWSDRTDAALPRLRLCRDDAEEAEAVADQVLFHHEQGVALRAQAVLMRAAHHSSVLELELGRRAVPFVKYGGIRYIDAAHVKDYLALVRLAVNPSDWVSWFRILQLLEGVGPRTARALLDQLRVDEPAPPLTLRWGALDGPESTLACGAPLVQSIQNACETSQPGDQAAGLLRALAPLLMRRYGDAGVRLRDLELLAELAARAPSLEHFAAELVLDPPQSSSDAVGPPRLDEDYLALSTIHSAKGLEWDVVHLLHASDGNLPSDMALSSREALDEERRLLYVAVTRPRCALHVYVPLRYHHRARGTDDANGVGDPSRFLTPEVRTRCETVYPPGPVVSLAGPAVHETVAASVEALWE